MGDWRVISRGQTAVCVRAHVRLCVGLLLVLLQLISDDKKRFNDFNSMKSVMFVFCLFMLGLTQVFLLKIQNETCFFPDICSFGFLSHSGGILRLLWLCNDPAFAGLAHEGVAGGTVIGAVASSPDVLSPRELHYLNYA